jgi:uncharacterized protein
MATLDRYSPGVMYKAMDFAGLPTGAQRRLLENGIIFSGVFGLLRPDDLIPNYRLKMDATLPEIGNVGAFWKPHISPILNRRVEDRIVWNLLPGIHRDAWDDEMTYRSMVNVRFYDEIGGERKPVTHNVKPLRGQLVNFIVRETAENVDALEAWQPSDGYMFEPEATVEDPETRQVTVSFVRRG